MRPRGERGLEDPRDDGVRKLDGGLSSCGHSERTQTDAIEDYQAVSARNFRAGFVSSSETRSILRLLRPILEPLRTSSGPWFGAVKT